MISGPMHEERLGTTHLPRLDARGGCKELDDLLRREEVPLLPLLHGLDAGLVVTAA